MNPCAIYWMDMTFFTLISCSNCIVCLKRPKINEKEAENSYFKKDMTAIVEVRTKLVILRKINCSKVKSVGGGGGGCSHGRRVFVLHFCIITSVLGPIIIAIINDASGAIMLNFAMYIECPNDNDDNDDDDDDEDDDDDGVTIKTAIKQLSLLR